MAEKDSDVEGEKTDAAEEKAGVSSAPPAEERRGPMRLVVISALVSAVATVGVAALLVNIFEFEMYNQGVHARSGVACADCHMPYKREGAMKISDHHVRSPLLNVNRACQTCHKWSEDELRTRVHTIQDRTFELRNTAMDALVQLIGEIKSAKAAGRSDDDLAAARKSQRKAQFFLDFIEAENSMGFHAPQESARILAHSIDATRQGELSLYRKGPVPTPAVVEAPASAKGGTAHATDGGGAHSVDGGATPPASSGAAGDAGR